MKTLFCLAALISGSVAALAGSYAPPAPPTPKALTCFLKGEQITGLNKICFYDCLGSGAAITVSSVQLCPLSIER